MREPSVTVYTQELHALTAICTWKSQIQSLPVERISNVCLMRSRFKYIPVYFLCNYFLKKHGKNTSRTTISERFGGRKTLLSLLWLLVCLLGKLHRLLFTWGQNLPGLGLNNFSVTLSPHCQSQWQSIAS